MTRYLKISIFCGNKIQELLIAELGLAGIDSFQQFENSLDAFVDENRLNEKKLRNVLKRYDLQHNYRITGLEEINWNEAWEKNFDPVLIEDQVQVRASFHQKKEEIKYDIIINPKMSFGTGHHETTCLMIAEQLKTDHRNKRILDVGAGTGILSIMAYKLGAKSIVSTDVDDWCIENCRENFELNKLKNFQVLHGKIENLTLDDGFDVILANINKNVLINEIPTYSNLLFKNGILLLSGFYAQDIKDLQEITSKYELELIGSDQKNDWSRLSFCKIST